MMKSKSKYLHKADLQLLIWMRIIRFQEEFEFIDNTKLGITGYSNGISYKKNFICR